ncbi:hypothetical protein [Kribbella sp. HUAS MG21]|uniref:MmcQ/YjbR family DNA-binding protein n=1 Tax=Kribbella sp. HUAS MG21 TaxID=3160966 RepID=A0AAU7T8J9_9ACTN
MTSWREVCELAGRLPDARLGEAHEGSPAWYAGRHQFARLRWDDDGRELLQVWTGDMDAGAALAGRPDVFPVVNSFQYRVTAWCYLDRIDLRETAELLLDSYGIRGGPTRRRAVDPDEFLPPV